MLRDRDYVFQAAKGVLVRVDLSDWIIRHALIQGYDREPLFAFSWSMIRPGDTVIDVGANIGVWSIAAARRVGPGGRVYAFEPQPVTFARLNYNLLANGINNVVAEKLAILDREGAHDFFVGPGVNSGAARSRPRPDWAPAASHVEGTTLDAYCERRGIASIRILKIDVEGGEYLVLSGTKRLLASSEPPVVVFEMDRELATDFDSSPEKIVALLGQFGYSFYRESAGALEKVSVADLGSHEDLIAFRGSTVPWTK